MNDGWHTKPEPSGNHPWLTYAITVMAIPFLLAVAGNAIRDLCGGHEPLYEQITAPLYEGYE